MIFKLFLTAATFFTATTATQYGPSALYTLLNGQTFNPPGYSIVMYQSCMQNQNSGNPCGSFTNFVSSNGQYTYQQYGPAPCSGSCCRQFELTLACGPTMQMSGVSENPTCDYHATLTLPQVCGVDMTVGNEASSVSPTALPPTSSPTQTPSKSATSTGTQTSTETGTPTTTASITATETSSSTITSSTTNTLTATSSSTMTATPSTTISATSTPLFEVTAFPTTTSTMTLTASATPLFMITAYPTTSPVNVTPTSTPLFFYTPYPSVQANGTSDLLAQAQALLNSGNPTSVILGSVALGVVGLGAIAATVAYFRNGGTVGGFLNKVKAQKGAIQQFANALPISADQKAKLGKAIDDPTSLAPQSVREKAEDLKHRAEDLKHQAESANQSIIQMLPPSIAQAVAAKEVELTKQIQDNVNEKVAAVSSFVPVPINTENQTAPTTETPIQNENADTNTQTQLQNAANSLVHLALKPEEMEAFKAFLDLTGKQPK